MLYLLFVSKVSLVNSLGQITFLTLYFDYNEMIIGAQKPKGVANLYLLFMTSFQKS